MVSLVLGMLVCVGLALVVMALVAVPARRAGREVLTERGEEVIGSLRDRQLVPGRSGRADEATPCGPRSPWAPAPEPLRTPRPHRETGVGCMWFDGPVPEPKEPAAVRSGIDHTAVDPDVRPQDDLFAHVNGRWLATTQIPEDRGRYGTFDVLRETRRGARARHHRGGRGRRPRARHRRGQGRRPLRRLHGRGDAVEALGVGPLADDLAQVRAVVGCR